MKISRNWLQKFFEKPLPDTEAINTALTFHAFEIEECESDLMDVKVLSNRAADCLCHRGIATELSAILDIPLKSDPLRDSLPAFSETTELSVQIEDPKKCLRYMGALVKGIKVDPSPDWLREALESVGQRSINNIVDATNYVMLNIGQPLHAFDAKKITQKNNQYAIGVRNAEEGEKITVLSGEEYAVPASVPFITDANANIALAIAGVKGGTAAEITEATTDLIVESANFDGTTVRRSAQVLKLVTEASLRFQNRPSPELCAYGMRDVLALIQEIASGEVVGITDVYPTQSSSSPVSTSLQRINDLLGSDFSKEEVAGVFKRLALPYTEVNSVFTITPPFERTDLVIPEDLAEEVGRILGYDRVPATELPPIAVEPNQARYRGIEKVKDFLIERGFTEISTQSFAKKGDVYLANPLDKTKPALRKDLKENMQEALVKAKQYAPLVLAPNQKPKLFEIGTVFTKEGEKLAVETSEPVSDLPEIKDDQNYIPQKYELGAYKPFSAYPFIVRDIAFWIPAEGVDNSLLSEQYFDEVWQKEMQSSDIVIKRLFMDRFPKDGRVSMAYRLIFQSFGRTLTDDEVNGIMQKITTELTSQGYEVR